MDSGTAPDATPPDHDHDVAEATSPEQDQKAPPAKAKRSTLQRFLPRPLRHALVLFVLVLIVEYFVIPAVSDARKSIHLLGRVNIVWLVAGTLLEACSLASYAFLTRSVLPRGQIGYGKTLRIDLSTLAVTHILPGGTASGSALGYRLFTTNGVSGSDTGFALATQGLGSAVVLNVLLWLALVISIPLNGFNKIYVSVALIAMLLLLGFAALIYLLTLGEETAARILGAIARRIPLVNEERTTEVVRNLALRLRDLVANRDLLRDAIAWAAANWLFDAASLWAFLGAFHHLLSPVSLFVAYGVAMVLAVIPISPGGLGIVELTATGLLAGFHVPYDTALLAVLGWRLVNFWLPIPIGAGTYLSLRVEKGGGLRARRSALTDFVHPSEPA